MVETVRTCEINVQIFLELRDKRSKEEALVIFKE